MIHNKIRGEITVLVKEVGTDETVAEYKETNVFTDFGLLSMFWGQNQNFTSAYILIASSSKIPLNSINSAQTIPNTSYQTGYVPSGLTQVTWGEPQGGQPWFGQLYNRFDPPSSTRTISFIGMEYGTGANTDPRSNYSGTALLAYATLATPCTQTTTQYLDIYYKVYFPLTTTAPISSNVYRELVRSIIGVSPLLSGGSGPLGGYVMCPWQSAIQPGTKNKNGILIDTNITVNGVGSPVGFENYMYYTSGSPNTGINTFFGAPQITFQYDYASITQSFSYSQTQFVGVQMNTMLGAIGTTNNLGIGVPSVSYPIQKTSNIQNVFRHSASSTLPLLDVNGLATSLGNAVPSGTWDSANNLSDMYFIDIVTGGPVGTATYRYRRRKVIQLVGNTYQYIGAAINNLCCDTVSAVVPGDTVVPQLTTLTTTSDYNHRISCSKSLNNHTVVMVYTDFIIVHDIITNISTTYSATNYPAFTPTDITQIETDSANNIWVACRNTGLYRINGTTITAYGAAQGLPTNGCFGVHSGKVTGGNEKIWAVFNGAIASATAADGFTTWTQYTPSSTPAFSYTGISDGNWNTVMYIKVDPQTDQMILVRSPTTTVVPSTVGVWWSPVGTASPLTITPNQASPSMADFRVHRQLLDVSKNSSFWVVAINDANNNASYQKLTFGSPTSTVLTTTSTAEAGLIGVYFDYDYIAGTDTLLVYGPSSNNPSNVVANGAQPRPVTAVTPSGVTTTITSSSSPEITGAGGGDNVNYRVSYGNILSSTVSPSTSVHDIYVKIYLERGLSVLTSCSTANNSIVVVNTQVWASPYATNAPDGGALRVFNEYEYGWNGTAWVLGSTQAATTSTSPQLLDNGVSIAFTDGNPSTQSFVAGDYFSFMACNGIFKDNASSLSFSTVQYLKNVLFNQTDMPSSISGPYAAVTTPTIQSQYTELAAGVTVNPSNQVVLTGQPGDYAVMDFPFSGNFDVTIDLSSVPLPKGTKIGLGIGTQIYYGVGYDTTGTQYSWWRNWDGDQGQILGTSLSYYGSYYNGNPSPVQPSSVQSIRFTRTGTSSKTISMYVNGTLIHSDTTALFTTGPIYQLIFRSWQSVGPVTIGAVTITSADASAPIVKLGNAANQSGAYDPYFYGLDVVQPSTYHTLTIAGVPVTNVYASTSGTTPNSGEIVVDQSGWIQFNPNDVAKALGGTYLYLQDPGII